jgi:hypothetical protein
MIPDGSFVVGKSSLLWGVVGSEAMTSAIAPYLSYPFVTTFHNAHESRRVCSIEAAVSQILVVGADSQVFTSVVEWVVINVIYIEPVQGHTVSLQNLSVQIHRSLALAIFATDRTGSVKVTAACLGHVPLEGADPLVIRVVN